jgi:capsid protein
MSILHRLAALFSRNYEAARISSPSRSASWTPYQDARYDASSMDRTTIAAKMRKFAQDCWIVNRLADVYIRYAIGTNGLSVTPASCDLEFNKRMADAFAEWAESPFLDSWQSLADGHVTLAETYHIEGENFCLLTNDKVDGQPARPALRILEPHRVAGGAYTGNLIDGVFVDANGCPTGYQANIGLENKPSVVSVFDVYNPMAGGMVHTFKAERAGMYRGISPYHSVLNDIHDLFDLELMEMQRAKVNSAIANAIITETGSLKHLPSFRSRSQPATTTATPNEDLSTADTARIEFYQKITGVRTIALKKGEDIRQVGNANPSAATQWFWRYKLEQVTTTLGTPIILVLPESLQGTVARAVLDDAAIYFRKEFNRHARLARAIYRFYASWARFNVPGLQDAPADWARCHVVPPRAPNVDVGRNSNALLSELTAGAKCLEDIASPDGRSVEELLTNKARNVAMAKRIAAAVSVESGYPVNAGEIMGDLAAQPTPQDSSGRLASPPADSETGEDAEDSPDDDEIEKAKAVLAAAGEEIE